MSIILTKSTVLAVGAGLSAIRLQFGAISLTQPNPTEPDLTFAHDRAPLSEGG